MNNEVNHSSSLAQWLAWQESLHSQEIDLGLERVGQVYQNLRLASCRPTIIVAGTNGKGSCLSYLDQIYRDSEVKTGLYTSPHLTRYNERIRIDGEVVEDVALVRAFNAINLARASTPLTYFEFSTLAALYLFDQANVELRLLEVGLGGRLDAVNIVDADVAVITSIDLDHQAWLGTDRESIGFEKAGIFRDRQIAICGERNPPSSVAESAHQCGALLKQIGQDFGFEKNALSWTYWDEFGSCDELQYLSMAGDAQLCNASCAIAATRYLKQPKRCAPLSSLSQVRVPGRIDTTLGDVSVTLDVAHNPAAVAELAKTLVSLDVSTGRMVGVVGVLADKEVAQMLEPITDLIDCWYVGGIQHHRGMDGVTLAGIVNTHSDRPVQVFDTVEEAYCGARKHASPGDHIVVFGSFHTVGAVLDVRDHEI